MTLVLDVSFFDTTSASTGWGGKSKLGKRLSTNRSAPKRGKQMHLRARQKLTLMPDIFSSDVVLSVTVIVKHHKSVVPTLLHQKYRGDQCVRRHRECNRQPSRAKTGQWLARTFRITPGYHLGVDFHRASILSPGLNSYAAIMIRVLVLDGRSRDRGGVAMRRGATIGSGRKGRSPDFGASGSFIDSCLHLCSTSKQFRCARPAATVSIMP